MPDQLSVFLLVTGHVLKEVGGSGLCNGTEIFDEFVPGHADTVVYQSNGLCGVIVLNADLEVRVLLQQLGSGKRFEPKPVRCIRGVRYQFPQEYFLVAVQ